MNDPSEPREFDPRLVARFHTATRVATLASALIGVAAMLGWFFGISMLKTVVHGFASMKINAALAIILASAALLGRSPPHGPLSFRRAMIFRFCSCAVLSIGLLTLIEYRFGIDLGIDQLLVRDLDHIPGSAAPGRMEGQTAFAFFALGAGMLALDRGGTRATWIAQSLAAFAGVIGLIALLGYCYGAPLLEGIAGRARMALHTAVAIECLAGAILSATPTSGFVAIIVRDHAGGAAARRLIPVIIVVQVSLGWLCVHGNAAGLYAMEMGIAILVHASILVLGVVVLRYANALNRADLERKEAEAHRVLSLRDTLTGLYNRRGFVALAEQHRKLADRARTPMLLVFVDLDGLKQINDRIGHAEGDRLIADAADVLRRTFRDADILARLGGDEFLALALGATPSDRAVIQQRLQANVEAFNRSGSRTFELGWSTGFAAYDPATPRPIEALIAEADERMYEEKRSKGAARAL